MHYCWTHNTCSSIAKTHADALSHYWASRQTRKTRQLFVQKTLYNYYWACTNYYRPCLYLHMVHWSKCPVRLRSWIALANWISLRLLYDLLHSHVDRQSDMGKLVFAWIWIAGNSCRGEQTMPYPKNKALNKKFSQLKFKRLSFDTYFALFSTYFSAIV